MKKSKRNQKVESENLAPWNKGIAVGQKKPFTPQQVRIIKELLEGQKNWRDLNLFSVGIDTMLRSSDMLNLKVEDVTNNDGSIKKEFYVMQQKTGKGNLTSITKNTQRFLIKWIKSTKKYHDDFIFTGLTKNSLHKKISHMQHTRLVKRWAELAKLDPNEYSTHSVRRTRAAHIYKMTGNIEAVRLLLGQKNISATSSYLNIDKRQALDIAESFEL